MPQHTSSGSFGSVDGGVKVRGRFGNIWRDQNLIGQTIRITSGPYKNAVGIVKDATECTSRVELHSSCQTISVDKKNLMIVRQQTNDGIITSSYFKTPTNMLVASGYSEGSTPVRGLITPNYDAGNCTPNFDNMTPSHVGSRTPNQVWNPTTGPTPVIMIGNKLQFPNTYSALNDSYSTYQVSPGG